LKLGAVMKCSPVGLCKLEFGVFDGFLEGQTGASIQDAA
jgi:hypothetical protein